MPSFPVTMWYFSKDHPRDQGRQRKAGPWSPVLWPQQSWRDENPRRGENSENVVYLNLARFVKRHWRMSLHGWQKEGRLQSLMPQTQQGWLFSFWIASTRIGVFGLPWPAWKLPFPRRQSIQSRGWPQFSNRERRELLHSKVVTEMGYKLFFVESICEDEATIEANIRFVCLLSCKAKAR